LCDLAKGKHVSPKSRMGPAPYLDLGLCSRTAYGLRVIPHRMKDSISDHVVRELKFGNVWPILQCQATPPRVPDLTLNRSITYAFPHSLDGHSRALHPSQGSAGIDNRRSSCRNSCGRSLQALVASCPRGSVSWPVVLASYSGQLSGDSNMTVLMC
jgi:hypothetical protein